MTDDLVLVDQHCHGVVAGDLDRARFAGLLTESSFATNFDSMVGVALRRWCAPWLELPAHCSVDDYLERRAEWGWRRVSAQLLGSAGVRSWLLDTGLTGVADLPLTEPVDFADIAGGAAFEVLRLESVAERVAVDDVSAVDFLDFVENELRDGIGAGAVGLKSVVAYRTGLELPAEPPTDVEVAAAASAWLRWGGGRIDDPILLAWLVHLGARLSAELHVPLQLHTGFGDDDLRLHRADPALLGDFLHATKSTGATIALLHTWPFHRHAGYLAHVFPHVLVDVGLAIPYVGDRAGSVLAELLELAPFGSVCFSSDGYGLPELHHLGATLWRRALGRLIDDWLADDVMTTADAEAFAVNFAAGNCCRAYGLTAPA
ncbi:amidohydrolase [Kutzneria sp. CA-103260]|uniref:amidohydrolase n=1 Tax=Kutzneria sp. CA-103260 TaxID=2802641 RepID=UPI001BAA4422|nr:amidohydrolase [Kutzneria sp. CA-103260]